MLEHGFVFSAHLGGVNVKGMYLSHHSTTLRTL